MALKWVKSSYSSGTGGNCVELARLPATILVRDSKDPDGPEITFTAAGWRAFARRVKAGQFG